jgi:uncharacterized protein (TIGR03435 family)
MGDHLWQSTLFLAVAAILALALRKNQARVRYWVWLTASVKFLIPFSLLIALGSHLAKPRASAPAQVIVYSVVEDFSQPFAGQQMPVLYPQAPTAAPVSLLRLLPAIVVAVWLVGIVVVLLRGLIGWVRISRMVRKAASVGEGPEVDALRRLESSLGVRKPIKLVLSPDWMEPGIFGIFRPVLIWPEGISKHLDDRHIEAILAHEVSHVRRHDNLTAVLHMLVEAVFWFHPLVWWMGARLEEERERACDEEVSLLCNQPHVYAESILRVCKFCSESPLACVSGITGADLKKRIMQIMTERVVRKLDLGRKLLLVTVGLAVVAVPIVLAQAKAAQRMMLAAVANAPKPFRAAAHAMMPLEETPATGEIAEVQMPSGADATLAQARAEAKPFAFDVVSIRPAAPPANDVRKRMIGYSFTDDGFVANSPLLMTLTFQYLPELQGDSTRIVGGPEWVRTIPWEIRAKVADSDIAEWSKLRNDPSPEARQRQRATVDAMLAERFKLKTHLESKESAIYALVVSKGGPNLKPAKPDARPGFTSGSGRFSSQVVTLGLVAQVLGHELGRPVIDKTELTGNYAITLNWSPAQGAAAASGGDAAEAGDSAAPSLFTAVQEQLGLKLEAQKGPIKTLVIDSAEKPSVDGAEVPDASGAQSQPQGTAAPLPAYEYEAATIKPSQGPGPYKKIGLWAAPDGFNAWFITPQQIISIAYGVESFQFSGGPSWLPSERFDIQAKMDAATTGALAKLSQAQRVLAQQQMLQALLADRFQLTVHRETKEGTIYTLVIAKGGPKLQEAKPGDPGADNMTSKSSGDLTAQAVPIARLVRNLTQMLGHPVLDKTELKGVYDFKLQFTPDDRLQSTSPLAPNARLPEPPADSNAPSLFDALQEQLGLKLESGKGPVEVIVIDHVERPSGN